jgi:hypothetical protein
MSTRPILSEAAHENAQRPDNFLVTVAMNLKTTQIFPEFWTVLVW